MDVSSISQTLEKNKAAAAASGSATSGTASDTASLSNNYNNFLLLLTKQLQNQDPLSPMDTAQFTQQLVSFASVEQQIKSNANLDKLISLQNATNTYGAVNFIGNVVAVDSDKVALQNKQAFFDYSIDHQAGKALLKILDKNGQTVMIKEADKTVGTHKAVWDGTDFFGNQLPDGQYSVAVSYEDTSGKSYTSKITSYGLVDSAEVSDGQVLLHVGDVAFPLDKVLKITKPSQAASNNTDTPETPAS